jgi:TPP-dependent pyruvate/acetoin dehydrogenase alpha subunit
MPADEQNAALAADPTQRFRASLVARPDISEEDLASLDKAARTAVDEAAAAAVDAPFPEPVAIRSDVYAQDV